jgi:hypothetical protein
MGLRSQGDTCLPAACPHVHSCPTLLPNQISTLHSSSAIRTKLPLYCSWCDLLTCPRRVRGMGVTFLHAPGVYEVWVVVHIFEQQLLHGVPEPRTLGGCKRACLIELVSTMCRPADRAIHVDVSCRCVRQLDCRCQRHTVGPRSVQIGKGKPWSVRRAGEPVVA